MKQASILLVDDDRLILSTLSDGLEKAGFRTAIAADGEQALAIIEAARPDLVILDIRMPGMSGIDLAQRLNTQGIPFIALTAYAGEQEVNPMVEYGALAYLMKPVDPSRLIPAVSAALERARDIVSLRTETEQLNQALQGDRNTSKAIGILMERKQLSGEAAFDCLRQHARSSRRKMADVAHEVVSAADLLNQVEPS